MGDLRKGINPPSIGYLNFKSEYLTVTVKAGIITALIALAVKKRPRTLFFPHLFY